MHELAVTESILEIATTNATLAEAKRVTDIHLVIGRLAGIVDDSVQFYWDILTKDTICENSRLHFQRKEAVFRCLECGNEYSLTDEMMPCPKCNSLRIEVISGEEFYLDSIEIEK